MVSASTGGVAVKGEVYHISVDVRILLDEVEGVDEELYVCQPVLLAEPFDSTEVLTYLYNQPVTHLADCGRSWPAS